MARTSYELVGAPPTLVAAACVVAASPNARAVAEAASQLDTPWGGSPSRVQAAAALLRADVWKSKFYGAFVLNRRVVLHAIDATPA